MASVRMWLSSNPPRRVRAALEAFQPLLGRAPRGYQGLIAEQARLLERTFEEVEGYDEMIVLRDIEFESHCEHHMAPIIGKAHVGYLPRNKVVGISKLARVV